MRSHRLRIGQGQNCGSWGDSNMNPPLTFDFLVSLACPRSENCEVSDFFPKYFQEPFQNRLGAHTSFIFVGEDFAGGVAGFSDTDIEIFPSQTVAGGFFAAFQPNIGDFGIFGESGGDFFLNAFGDLFGTRAAGMTDHDHRGARLQRKANHHLVILDFPRVHTVSPSIKCPVVGRSFILLVFHLVGVVD